MPGCIICRSRGYYAGELPAGGTGERVLDVCAAPGGKATESGAKLKGDGVLIANDISNSRAKGLLKNLELFGIGNMLVLSEEPGKLAEYFTEYFDKILIDAPCSGEGMFRKDKELAKAWRSMVPNFFQNSRGVLSRRRLLCSSRAGTSSVLDLHFRCLGK